MTNELAKMKNAIAGLPQTDFTKTIPVTVYDAKTFLGRIQSQIEILEMVNKTDEAKHWKALKDQAEMLFKIGEDGQ